MKTAIKRVLACSVVVVGVASAALPYAITATATGNSLGDAMSNAEQDAQARCLAAGLGRSGNLRMTDSRRLGLMWQVTVAGNCSAWAQVRQ